MEILIQKYERVFFYSEKIKNSENLAFKIIYLENKLSRFSKITEFKDDFITKSNFDKLMISHFQDVRIKEVLNVMLGNSIKLPVDLNDTLNLRQGTFILCSFSIIILM